MKLTTKTFENVIGGILELAQKERREKKEYKDLFSNPDIYSLLVSAQHKIDDVVLDTVQILEEKHGIKITDEKYMFLLGLSLYYHLIEKDIEKNEGSACEVEKTHATMVDYIIS